MSCHVMSGSNNSQSNELLELRVAHREDELVERRAELVDVDEALVLRIAHLHRLLQHVRLFLHLRVYEETS